MRPRSSRQIKIIDPRDLIKPCYWALRGVGPRPARAGARLDLARLGPGVCFMAERVSAAPIVICLFAQAVDSRAVLLTRSRPWFCLQGLTRPSCCRRVDAGGRTIPKESGRKLRAMKRGEI